jgi:hypothetical protein
MKIDKADQTFSAYIRERDNWTCQRCKTKYEPGSQGLHCSHFFGRRNESTRFEPSNATAICFGCHQYFDETNRMDYMRFKMKQLGEKRFKWLEIQVNTYHKKDRAMSLLQSRLLLRDLLDERGSLSYYAMKFLPKTLNN